ncbi:MAG: helix-turn-helix transcriptional regulator [Anaerolineae bacterium]|nr:helix-turn-helix transcriptional regulator [Anaerolineae bacterium]
MSTIYDRCACGRRKTSLARRCRICFLEQTSRNLDHVCPECGRTKSVDATVCIHCKRSQKLVLQGWVFDTAMTLRLRRKEADLTLRELAERCGTSISHLSDIEHGALPSLELQRKLINELRSYKVK